MSEILDFFIQPYRGADIIMVVLEFIAAFFGVISVYYAKKENILVYPTGIISTVIYVFLLSRWNLYGDLIINIYYTLMSIYGWYMWSRLVDEHHITITRSGTRYKIKAFCIFIFTSLFLLVVYRYYNVMPNELGIAESIQYTYKNMTSGSLEDFRKITPYLDTFTTGVFFAAMWQMANKKIESWKLWIAGDIVSVPLYFVKGYGFTGIQYAIFLVLAVQGYREWKKLLKE